MTRVTHLRYLKKNKKQRFASRCFLSPQDMAGSNRGLQSPAAGKSVFLSDPLSATGGNCA